MIARRDLRDSKLRRDDLVRKILKVLRDEEMYGYAIRERLQTNGFRIELTNLYKLLTDMEKKGLIKGEWHLSETGPKRRVYKLSESGREELNRMLLEAARTIHEFYGDYLTSLPARSSLFKKIDAMIERTCTEKNSAIIVPARPHVMYQYFIMNLSDKVKEGKVYLIKPPELSIQLAKQPENLITLSYIHNKIPLKDSFLDSIRALAVPFEEEMLKEFHRVLKKEGCLLLLMPHLKRKEEEPLSIGDFMEKIEHGAEEEAREMNEQEIVAIINRHFGKVEVSHIAHLTVFTASKSRSI